MEMLRLKGIVLDPNAQAYYCLANTFFSCLRNVVALFHVIERELEWRRAHGRVEGFETMHTSKPIVAIGAHHPLNDELLMADYFRMFQAKGPG